MFIIEWVFDKLGYMPKIDVQVGKIDLELKNAWPFPLEEEKPKKPTVKKATTRTPKKPAVAAKTTRTKKVK